MFPCPHHVQPAMHAAKQQRARGDARTFSAPWIRRKMRTSMLEPVRDFGVEMVDSSRGIHGRAEGTLRCGASQEGKAHLQRAGSTHAYHQHMHMVSLAEVEGFASLSLRKHIFALGITKKHFNFPQNIQNTEGKISRDPNCLHLLLLARKMHTKLGQRRCIQP